MAASLELGDPYTRFGSPPRGAPDRDFIPGSASKSNASLLERCTRVGRKKKRLGGPKKHGVQFLDSEDEASMRPLTVEEAKELDACLVEEGSVEEVFVDATEEQTDWVPKWEVPLNIRGSFDFLKPPKEARRVAREGPNYTQGVPEARMKGMSPFQVFLLFWPLGLFRTIVEETNKYATVKLWREEGQRASRLVREEEGVMDDSVVLQLGSSSGEKQGVQGCRHWKADTLGELLKWFGMYVAMSIHALPRAETY